MPIYTPGDIEENDPASGTRKGIRGKIARVGQQMYDLQQKQPDSKGNQKQGFLSGLNEVLAKRGGAKRSPKKQY